MLEIEDLCCRADTEAGPVEILKDISLTVEDGSFTAVTGPNGGGKSTLAKTIMGLMPASSGRIIWDGTDITHMDVTERARLGISYGFQTPPRFKGLRVLDLLEIASGNENLSREDCCNYLTRVGLCAGDYIDREVDSSLSGGEVKRIEIATILARSSGLMIFDEPEAGIDLWSFAKLTDTFRLLHERRKCTLIIISHQERILSMADEIVMVTDGEITRKGPRDEIFPEILANASAGCDYLTREDDTE